MTNYIIGVKTKSNQPVATIAKGDQKKNRGLRMAFVVDSYFLSAGQVGKSIAKPTQVMVCFLCESIYESNCAATFNRWGSLRSQFAKVDVSLVVRFPSYMLRRNMKENPLFGKAPF